MRIKVAGFVFEINNRYSYSEQFVTDYLTDEEPDCHISLDEEFLLKRQEKSPDKPLHYLEFLEIYRVICDYITEIDGILIHGAVIEFDNNAYMFTAPSGTGKTTHIKQWKKLYGSRVKIVNGDKPIIRLIGDEFFAYGTPWCGKEHFNRNTKVPLRGIVVLTRSDENFIELVPPSEFNQFLLKQLYMPKKISAKLKTLDIADKLFEKVPLYRLGCNISTEAARVACEGICNNS